MFLPLWEIVLLDLISREESVCSDAITFVWIWPSPVQRRFLLNGVKSTAGPRPKGCSGRYRTLECDQPSPALRFCYAMLAMLAMLAGGRLLRPMIVVQRASEGQERQERQERLHARAQSHSLLRARSLRA